MKTVLSRGGSVIGRPLLDRSYWAAKLKDSTWLTELDTMTDIAHAGKRPFDWTLDVVATGDWARITELWLFCPRTRANPVGSTARLPIAEAGTAFQLKIATLSGLGAMQRTLQAQVIGRVTDKESGTCECFIYDDVMQSMSEPWISNVYAFGSWRAEIAPLGLLNFEVVGLHLATHISK